MQYDKKEDYTFFYLTLCYGILYTDDLQIFLEDANEFVLDLIGPEFLKMTVDIFTRYSKKGKLSNHSISNIYDFANYCRFNENVLNNQEVKDEIYNYCNQLISLANNQRYNEKPPAYYEEISSRYKSIKEVILKTLSYWNDPEKFKDSVHYMRELDFRILCIHSELATEEEFELELESMLADPHYLICIEYLLDTYPRLFNDEQFKSRVLKGLEANRQLILEAKGKALPECIYSADEIDIKILNNSTFIKSNRNLNRRIINLRKDS